MKTAVKYVSLLLLCGLTLPFYNNSHLINKYGKQSVGHSNLADGQTIFIINTNDSSFTEKIGTVKTTQQRTQQNENTFSFFRDVITNILPALKKLN